MNKGHHGSDWNDANVELMTRLHAEGKTSRQIAQVLGWPSRNAVIGKLLRLGISGRHGPRRTNSDLRRALVAKAKKKSRPTMLRPKSTQVWIDAATEQIPVDNNDHAIPESQRKSLIDLEPHHCKFPVGDPQLADFFFCGARREPSLPYCRDHVMRAYQPPDPKRRKLPGAAKVVVRVRTAEFV